MMFTLGFKKIALDLRGARTAGKRLAKNVVRREAGVVHAALGIQPKADVLRKSKTTLGPAFNSSTNKIHFNSDLTKKLREHGHTGKTPRGGAQKEMTNRVALLHEQSEKKHTNGLAKSKKAYFKHHAYALNGMFAGHAHPGVILEESNTMRSLPKKYKSVANLHHKMREKDATKSFLENRFPGFEYGKTRVSRHAKKRMSEAIGKDKKKQLDSFMSGFKKTADMDHNNQGLEFHTSDMGNPMIGPGGMGPSGDETYQPLDPTIKGNAAATNKKIMAKKIMTKLYKQGSGMEDAALSSGGLGSDIAPTTVEQLKWTSSWGPNQEDEAADRQEQKNRRKQYLKARKCK